MPSSGSAQAPAAIAAFDEAVAGFSFIVHGGGGFYWLAAAALLGTAGAVYNAWVLLVEIVR